MNKNPKCKVARLGARNKSKKTKQKPKQLCSVCLRRVIAHYYGC